MLLSFNGFVNEAKREGIFTGGLKTGASQAFIDRSKKTTSYKILKSILQLQVSFSGVHLLFNS